MDFSDKQNTFPLSSSQKNIWALEQTFPGTPMNNICTTIRIRGRFDLSGIQAALNTVLCEDDSLRTRLFCAKDEPLQFHAPYSREQFPFFDFSMTDEDGFESWETAVAREVMPITDSPLYSFLIFRRGENDGGILVKTHHLISDGWSQVLLSNRIGKAYLDFLEKKEPEPTDIPDYRLHVEAEAEYRSSSAIERDRAFFSELLDRAPFAAADIKACPGAFTSLVGRRKSYRLPQVLNHAIYSFCMENRVAPFAVFYMALAVYLKRINTSSRFAIGVPVFNRVNLSEKQTTGMFVSTLPFLNTLDDSWSLLEFNRRLSEEWYELLRHQKLSFSEITALAKERGLGALFHIVLSYQNSMILKSGDASVFFSGRWNYSGYQAEHLCIHLSNLEDNRKYAVDYDYLTQLFSEKEIDDLHDYLTNILSEALSFPERPLQKLAVLNIREKEKVLYDFNRTDRQFRHDDVFGELERIALEHPDRVAVICAGRRHTYRSLLEDARRIAFLLEEQHLSKGDLAAILLPRGADIFTAMAAVSCKGCAWLMLSDELPDGRIARILEKSGAKALLVNAASEPRAAAFPQIPVIQIDRASAVPEYGRTEKCTLSELAYVVYTSGSTGEPKGVEISHGNLLNFSCSMRPYFGRGAVLSVCSVGFDAFLLESITALLNAQTVVMALESEAENPAALSDLIAGYGVSFLSLTPSRLRAYMKNENFLHALRNMETILCGGEAFPGELLSLLLTHTNAKIYNQYGPSETTVGVSIKLLNACDRITVGAPMPNCRIYVLDERLHPLPIGVFGQVYIGGVCVGLGYRNDSALTEKSFLESPFESGERLYATGDFGCFTPSGELLLGARRDRQVKLRGLRVELSEIASRLGTFPEVQEVAVTLTQSELLAAYYVSSRDISREEWFSFASNCLPYYMVPSAFQRISALPLTPNGKINYAALPEIHVEISAGRMADGEKEQAVLAIFSQTLKKELSPDDDYFLCGGDSLSAMETLARLRDELGLSLRIAELYLHRTARAVAALCTEETPCVAAQTFRRAPKLPSYPLSGTQKLIFTDALSDPTGLSYNMPGAFLLPKNTDLSRLQNALSRLVADDDSFCSAFRLDGNNAVQEIRPVSFSVEELAAESFSEASEQFVRPFDLAAPPLFRAAFWKSSSDGTYLFLDMHHILADGMSTPVLLGRLDAFYRGTVPEEHLTYKDYAYFCTPSQELSPYWKDALSGAPLFLELPADYPEKKTFDRKGEALRFSISSALSSSVRERCRSLRISEFTFFAAAFGLLLGKFSGTEDLLVGTPVSGRNSEALLSVCGPLINTLPLRLSPEADAKTEDYLSETQQRVVALLDHSETSFSDLVSLCGVQHSMAHNPVYQVLFSFRPLDAKQFALDGEPLRYFPLETHTAKLFLNLECAAEQDGFSFVLEYAVSLFLPETIRLLAASFETVTAELLTSKPLSELSAVSQEDALRLFEVPHRTFTPYLALPVDRLFDLSASWMGDACAVIWHGEKTSFAALRTRAEELAGWICAENPERKPVAFALSRTPDLFAAMLAINKAGCAYLPALPDFPRERLDSMLSDADAAFLLCDEVSASLLPASLCREKKLLSNAAGTFSALENRSADDPIHILFTSGSTGRPKGVVLRHRSVSNLFTSLRDIVSGIDGTILCTTNAVFDTFMTESLFPLCEGRCIVLADEEEMMLPWKIAELISANNVKIMQFTPSRLQMCLVNEAFLSALPLLELVIVAGEALTEALSETFFSCGGKRLYNLYGPTEATVYATGCEIKRGERVSIGAPLKNCRAYVLDEARRPVMPCARGELWLAGECVACGYINRPELTAASFLPDLLEPGKTMYKTGDLVRLCADGTLLYLGRKDSQIKLNGQRIELSEINGQLLKSGMVSASAILPEQTAGGMTLRAFLVPKTANFDKKGLMEYLRAQLPSYMIPSELIVRDSLPLTATGKIDLTALSPNAPEAVREELRPDSSLLSVWREVLGKDEVSEELSFFEQGGTSLAALNVLARYFNMGLSMTLSEFYENPTLRLQYPILQKEQPAVSESGVFLTGATGFLGAHLLSALFARGIKKVFCLLRDGSRDRLFATLTFYFGDARAKELLSGVEVFRGDLTLAQFGLKKDVYSNLVQKTSAVIHSAADVRHYAPEEELLRANVTATKQVISFALAAGVPLIHISTVSVSGEYLLSSPGTKASFTEEDLEIGQNWQENRYVRTKFLAEQAIVRARKNGLHAKIMRIGRLVGRAADGRFQKNPQSNAFYRLVRGITALGAIPECFSGMKIDLTPVDVCADAILALSKSAPDTFHIFSPKPLSAAEIISALSVPVEICSDSDFEERLRRFISGGNLAEIGELLEMWNLFKTRKTNIHPQSASTIRELARRGISFPEPDPARWLSEFFDREV